jgi:hypothetical protein
METTTPSGESDRLDLEARPLPLADAPEITARDFRDGFGEELRDVLDVGAWQTGWDLTREYLRIEREVGAALHSETEVQRYTRLHLFPRLRQWGGGVYDARLDVIRAIHRGLLFRGHVEACDGTVQVHDTLPLTIYQIGVSLVSYRGDQGTWHQRLFRRDLRQTLGNRVEELTALLERRSRRAALNHATPGDRLGDLARKAIMAYAERAVLLERSTALWRMGHGNPVTYELLTGAGILELMVAATRVLRELITRQRKFVFVASEPRELLALTIGQALGPSQYATVWTLDVPLRGWLHQRRFAVDVGGRIPWDEDDLLTPAEWIPRFLEEIASQVVVGVYRASSAAPAQLFYAHKDHVHYAAHLALADSMLQQHRGFPLLIDVAHHVCEGVFGRSLDSLTQTAYASAGAPTRYFSERQTRKE